MTDEPPEPTEEAELREEEEPGEAEPREAGPAEPEGEPPEPAPATYALSTALFGRALGAVTLLAFVSLHAQVFGLFGSAGIDPMSRRVAFLSERFGASAFFSAPSAFFLVGGSDLALGLVVLVGELAALAMVSGRYAGPAALVAHACFLSFASLGAPFLPLQWDTLLLESLGVAAILLPWSSRAPLDRCREPATLARLALWFLVARLMFASGYVKLASGDEAWSSMRALDWHFETQPLPTALGYLLHFGPAWLRTAGAVLTFVVELAFPFLVFLGVMPRRLAGLGFVTLMLAVGLTGNYGFFNLLTGVLALSLLDDRALERALPASVRRRLRRDPSEASRGSRRARTAAASAQLALGSLALLGTLGAGPSLPSSVLALTDAVDPLRIANGYGLFAVMTRERPIVVFEGSADGETFEAYDYRYQSAALGRGPAQRFPHMPRLDWMIWFAGLGDAASNGWVTAVERGLLEARPDVLALFGEDPFHGERPVAVRAVRYFYRFAPPGDPDWWVRTDRMPYGPTLRRTE